MPEPFQMPQPTTEANYIQALTVALINAPTSEAKTTIEAMLAAAQPQSTEGEAP